MPKTPKTLLTGEKETENKNEAAGIPKTKECPDPNGVHGPGIMMNLTLMYGKPMYLCPSCAYKMQA